MPVVMSLLALAATRVVAWDARSVLVGLNALTRRYGPEGAARSVRSAEPGG